LPVHCDPPYGGDVWTPEAEHGFDMVQQAKRADDFLVENGAFYPRMLRPCAGVGEP
jgi:hypothetical protein